MQLVWSYQAKRIIHDDTFVTKIIAIHIPFTNIDLNITVFRTEIKTWDWRRFWVLCSIEVAQVFGFTVLKRKAFIKSVASLSAIRSVKMEVFSHACCSVSINVTYFVYISDWTTIYEYNFFEKPSMS